MARSAQSAGGGWTQNRNTTVLRFISPVSAGRIRRECFRARCQIMSAPQPPLICVRESRNPDGLAATLAHYFSVPCGERPRPCTRRSGGER